jgi:hypothetical protein
MCLLVDNFNERPLARHSPALFVCTGQRPAIPASLGLNQLLVEYRRLLGKVSGAC